MLPISLNKNFKTIMGLFRKILFKLAITTPLVYSSSFALKTSKYNSSGIFKKVKVLVSRGFFFLSDLSLELRSDIFKESPSDIFEEFRLDDLEEFALDIFKDFFLDAFIGVLFDVIEVLHNLDLFFIFMTLSTLSLLLLLDMIANFFSNLSNSSETYMMI